MVGRGSSSTSAIDHAHARTHAVVVLLIALQFEHACARARARDAYVRALCIRAGDLNFAAPNPKLQQCQDIQQSPAVQQATLEISDGESCGKRLAWD